MDDQTSRKITIKDVAENVGVSITTVSRFLSGKYQYMSLETQQKIRKAIEDLKYEPNNIARSLKSKRTKMIGVSLAMIESPFSASVVKGIFDGCRSYNYCALVVNSDDNKNIEEKNIRSLIARGVDGLIVNATNNSSPYLVELAESGFPIVLLDRFVNGFPFDISYIESTNVVVHAVKHLFNAGFKHLACFVPEYKNVSPRYMRLEAFIQTLFSLGFQDPQDHVYVVDTTNLTSIRQAVLQLIGKTNVGSPPAIFACTGVTLFSACNAILSLNLNIPTQIGICGMDDWGWGGAMDWAELVQPGITTMSPPTFDVGFTSAEMIVNRIQNKSISRQMVSFDSAFNIRRSTKLT